MIIVFNISCAQGCDMTPKHQGMKINNNNIFFFSIAYAPFLTESVITELVIQLWKMITESKILRKLTFHLQT